MLTPRLMIALIAVSLAASGCTKMGEFPSLAKRPFEQAPTDRPATAPAAMLDAAILAEVATLRDRAQDGDRSFVAALGDAQRAVARARGARPASESWVIAQVAVSRLEPLRLPAQTALNDLAETLRLAATSGAIVDTSAIVQAIGDVQRIKSEQDEAIASLIAALTK